MVIANGLSCALKRKATMKVTFIRPNIFDVHTLASMEVLCFAILKGLTPADIETEFYDERLGPIPYDSPTDLVAITIETFTARRAYQVALEYKKRGVRVVVGGFHPTFMPEEASIFADSVVVGDAEGIWPVLLEDFRKGRLQPLYRQDNYPSMIGMAVDHSIYKGKRYLPLTLVQYSRGCKFNCSFCSIHSFYGSSMRQRPVEELLAEIKRRNARQLVFVDDNIYINPKKAKELFTALIPLKVKWTCQVSIDVVKDPEVLELMARSGCNSALIGFESLNEDSLRMMNKKWNTKWFDYGTAIRRLQDAGIMIYGTFVFGYDGDTKDVFDRTVEFAIENKFLIAGFNPLMPTPGSKMYDDLVQEGRMIHEKWWIDPAYRYGDAVFHPKSMTADEFREGCYRARSTFSTYSSIFRRLPEFKTNLRSPYRAYIHLFSNYMLRREIHAKQGMPLGAVHADDPWELLHV